MDSNTPLTIVLASLCVLQFLGVCLAIRLVRAGGRPARDSELPTLRAPALPREFASGEWS